MSVRKPLLPSILTSPLRFGLRDVLLVTLLVAMGLAWWRDHRRQALRLDVYEQQVARWQFSGRPPNVHRTPLESAELAQAARRRASASPGMAPERFPQPVVQSPVVPPTPTLNELLESVEHGSNTVYLNNLVAYAADSSGEEAVPRLIVLLKSPRPMVRQRALESLGKLRALPSLAIPAIVPLLRDPGEGVGAEAAHALGCFGTDARSALPTLTDSMNDDNSPAAAAAALAITHIDSGREIGDRLIQLLRSPHDAVRIQAVLTLYDYASREAAEEALVEAYAVERNEAVKRAIIDVLNMGLK